MEIGITVAALLAMIALCAFLIHRLDDQHADRIALWHYGRRPHGRRSGHTGASPRPVTAPPYREVGRRDHRDGGRGRLRPRRRSAKST